MKHLNIYCFYELGSKLHALFEKSHCRVTEMFGPLSEAQALLDGWIKGDPYPLETSKEDATRLLNKLAGLFNKYYIDQSSKQLKRPTGEDRVDAHELALLQGLVEKFEHALAAEMNHAPTYVAGKRGIYSTYDLIENAYECFSENLRSYMPSAAMTEFSAAGRALAFGLGTAAGLHLLRSIELVLKRYYETFSGNVVGKNERTYAIYLKKLAALSEDEDNDFRPDKRLLQMLAQIKEHYRNPLTNPESNITMEQATSLFSLATAAITLMTEQVIAHKMHKPTKAEDEGEDLEDSAKKATEALNEVSEAAKDDTDPSGDKPSKKSKAG